MLWTPPPDPAPAAVLSATVLLLRVSVAALTTPPPSGPELPEIVESKTVMVPAALRMPPPALSATAQFATVSVPPSLRMPPPLAAVPPAMVSPAMTDDGAVSDREDAEALAGGRPHGEGERPGAFQVDVAVEGGQGAGEVDGAGDAGHEGDDVVARIAVGVEDGLGREPAPASSVFRTAWI